MWIHTYLLCREATFFPGDVVRLSLQLRQVDLLVLERERERVAEDLLHLCVCARLGGEGKNEEIRPWR